MNYILTKLFLVLLLALVIIQTIINLNLPTLKEDEFHVYQYKKIFLEENKDKSPIYYKHVIFGDCIGLTAVNPEYLESESLNLAFAGATPIEVYYAIKKFLQFNKAPEKITLILSSNQFLGLDLFYENALSMNMLTKDEINEVQINFTKYDFKYPGPYIIKKLNSNLLNSIFSILTSKTSLMIDYYAAKLAIDPDNLTRLKNCLFSFCFLDKRHDSFRYTKEHQGFYQYLINQPQSVYQYYVNWNEFVVPKVIQFYFDQIFQLAKKEKIKIAYHHPPITKKNKEAVTSSKIEEFMAFFDLFHSKYPSAKISKSVLVYPDDHFSTSIYLNNTGAEKFSRYLNEYSQK